MNVLMINGSPRAGGNTSAALKHMEGVFVKNGISCETVEIAAKDIRGCTACNGCGRTGRCVFDDIVNETAQKFEAADGFVVASPVYYASPNGSLISFLDRLFYSTPFDKTMKVGAAVVVARRGGCTASFDVLNKYFTISGMPIASSRYWNMVHGMSKGEAEMDIEGIETVKMLAENMSFLLRSIALGKEKFGLPEKGPQTFTNFIR